MKAKSIIIIILAIIALILIVQNTEVVPIQLLLWRIWMSRIVLIVLMLAIGFGIGFVLAKASGKKPAVPNKS
ncbi:MAG: LapA family protein [bacterium]